MNEDSDEESSQQVVARSLGSSVAGPLLVQLEQMLKKPTVEAELGEVLSKYWQYVRTSQAYMNNGILNLNFAEAALLLQHASALYSKKVDLLWDNIVSYQERMILYEERNENNEEEFNRVAERKDRNKRKKRKVEVSMDSVELSEINSIDVVTSVENPVRDLNSEITLDHMERFYEREREDESADLEGNRTTGVGVNTKHCDRTVNTILINNHREVKYDLSLYDREDTGGEDFFRNRCADIGCDLHENLDGDTDLMCDYGKTSMFLIQELYRGSFCYQRIYRGIAECRNFHLSEQAVNSWLIVKKLRVEDIRRNTEEFRVFFEECKALGADEENEADELTGTASRIQPKRPSVMLDRISPAVLHKHLLNEDIQKQISSTGRSNDGRKTVDARSEDSGYCEDSESLYATSETTPCNLLSPTPEVDESLSSQLDAASMTVSDSVLDSTTISSISPLGANDSIMDCTPPLGSHLAQSTPVSAAPPIEQRLKRNKKKKLNFDFIFEELSDDDELVSPKKMRKVSIEKLKPTKSASLKSFELFFYYNYKAEVGEGETIPPVFEEDEVCELFDSLAVDEAEPPPPAAMCAAVEEITREEELVECLVVDISSSCAVEETIKVPEQCGSVNALSSGTLEDWTGGGAVSLANDAVVPSEAIVLNGQLTVQVPRSPVRSPCPDNNQQIDWLYDECNEYDDRYEKYVEWKRFIGERVGTQSDADFDIHEEGTKIMQKIGKVGEKIRYNDLCAGKSTREVCRSFVAMLQLANAENVELIVPKSGVLANDCMELKLLSNERHHENLAEYSAPSTSTFQSRFSKARRLASTSRLSALTTDSSGSVLEEPQPGPSRPDTSTKRMRLS